MISALGRHSGARQRATRLAPSAALSPLLFVLSDLCIGCSTAPPGSGGEPQTQTGFGGRAAEPSPGSGDTGEPPATALRFTDVSSELGFDFLHGIARDPPHCALDNAVTPVEGDWCTPERMTAGSAIGSIRGALAIYLTRLDEPNVLLTQEPSGKFVDSAKMRGVTIDGPSNGAAWADVDRDGDLDLVVLSLGGQQDYLFIQGDDGTFSEEAVMRGVANLGQLHLGTTPAFGDYDLDGYPDLFIGSWQHYVESGTTSMSARLLRNRGAAAPGVFEDVTLEAGLESLAQIHESSSPFAGVFIFAPAFVDLDGDGFQDLALAADFGTTTLWWNNGDGSFTDGTQASKVSPFNAMGSAFGDIDDDGDLDWFITDIWELHSPNSGNRLYLNRGDRSFEDVTDEYGVRRGGWGWGASFGDFDNDLDLDLVMTAGWPVTHRETEFMRLWEADGAEPPEARWREVAPAAGLLARGQGRGLSLLDIDADGDQDILVTHNAETVHLYRNDSPPQGYVRVRAIGTVSDTHGHGAVVTAETPSGRVMTRHIGAGAHFLGQSEPVAHFGIGREPSVNIQVTFPATGRVRRLKDVLPGSVVSVTE